MRYKQNILFSIHIANSINRNTLSIKYTTKNTHSNMFACHIQKDIFFAFNIAYCNTV